MKASQTIALNVSLSRAVSSFFLSPILHEHSTELVHQRMNGTARKDSFKTCKPN